MRDYELVLVVKPDGGDEGFTATVERFSQFIKDQGGEITKVDPWGMRKLAYPIDRHMEGFYSVTSFKIEPSEVRALEENLGLAEDLLRHIVVRQDEAPAAAEASPASDESPKAEVPSADEASPVGDKPPVTEVPAADEASPVGDKSPSAEVPAADEASPVGDKSPSAEVAVADEASPAGDKSPSAEVAAAPQEEAGDVRA
ncbi:MAG: 30S ribosomal protein S6 [Chloroflexi bacterium]|nr:30S ribosomal protein S6 [Chloroflexota bacterium]